MAGYRKRREGAGPARPVPLLMLPAMGIGQLGGTFTVLRRASQRGCQNTADVLISIATVRIQHIAVVSRNSERTTRPRPDGFAGLSSTDGA